MINPLSVASDGYLSVTKRVLVIAVAGYLNFGGEPDPIVVIQPNRGGISSIDPIGGGSARSVSDIDEEEEIMVIINAVLRCL